MLWGSETQVGPWLHLGEGIRPKNAFTARHRESKSDLSWLKWKKRKAYCFASELIGYKSDSMQHLFSALNTNSIFILCLCSHCLLTPVTLPTGQTLNVQSLPQSRGTQIPPPRLSLHSLSGSCVGGSDSHSSLFYTCVYIPLMKSALQEDFHSLLNPFYHLLWWFPCT